MGHQHYRLAAVPHLAHQVPDGSPGLGVEAEDADAALVGDSQALEALNGSGLAGAVGPHDAKDLPLHDLKADAVHCLDLAVVLLQTLYLHHRVG
jgi:hypothetical protein